MASQTSVSPPAHPTLLRLRGGRTGSLEFALVFVAVFAAFIGIIQIGVGLRPGGALAGILAFTALFWIWVAAGIVAWWRRPTNGIGALILVGAAAIVLAGIGNLGLPALVVVEAVFATGILAVAVHLLHAFPSGRLRGRLSIFTVVLVYVVSLGFDTIRVLATGSPAYGTLSLVQSVLGLLAMALTAIVLMRRLLDADAAHRRVLLPLFLYGIIAVLGLPLVPNVLGPLGVDESVIEGMQLLLMAGLPIAFLIGVLLGGFTRTTPLEALSEWLAIRGASRPAVARALAATLGDSTLRVSYWDPARESFVDEHALAVPEGPSDPERGWLQVRVDEQLVGAIDYDARMIADPRPVRRAAEVLAIALDRERVTSKLITTNEELVLSRVRLVEAADRERSRIARDLHDGLQMQLVLLALEAQTIANAQASPAAAAAVGQLRRGIDQAAADLRRLVHDVLPAALLEQGLVGAAEDLVDRLAVPASLHAEIDESAITVSTAHTAYFIVAEALANTVKHARATTVRVTMTQRDGLLVLEVEDDGIGGALIGVGSGLRGLVDRVHAMGGTFAIDSAPEQGTLVRVELPARALSADRPPAAALIG